MTRDEIFEYPYMGVIIRTIVGKGDSDDIVVEIYSGAMDESMQTDDEGSSLQTSSYIVSIPLTKDQEGKYIIPIKGDKISLERFGQILYFTVDNAEPSQLGGVSIYSTRKDW